MLKHLWKQIDLKVVAVGVAIYIALGAGIIFGTVKLVKWAWTSG